MGAAIDPDRILGHRQVTDAHLLALADRYGGELVTFDRSIASLYRDGETAPLVVIGQEGAGLAPS